MKKIKIKCPYCGKNILIAIADMKDKVNGMRFDCILLDEGEELPK